MSVVRGNRVPAANCADCRRIVSRGRAAVSFCDACHNVPTVAPVETDHAGVFPDAADMPTRQIAAGRSEAGWLEAAAHGCVDGRSTRRGSHGRVHRVMAKQEQVMQRTQHPDLIHRFTARAPFWLGAALTLATGL